MSPATVASIIIPTYNHAQWLPDAIKSALAQTVPCEVIVVDDGSTDHTWPMLADIDHAVGNGNRFRGLHLAHGGPSAARNAGLAEAMTDFVMFLDADDVIAPTKVEKQIDAFTDDVDWVLSDTRIEDAGRGFTELASARYDYPRKALGGWIAALLEPANFIPIMAPLVRRSVLVDQGIRFAETVDGTPEDWRFWQRVAAVARVRYLPAVLATYRKQKTGRNRLPKAARAVVPNIEQPLRLNLGCGTPGTRSWHPIPGFVNLDKSLDWRFEDGLAQFADRSVSGVTISHSLMYLAIEHWPFVFAEFARVLVPGGVLRVTEDRTDDRASARYGGWNGSDPAITRTSPALLRAHMESVGLSVQDVTAETTGYADRSLLQAQHGQAPDVFFIEGTRQAGVLFAPHNDDESLFSAFTILKYRPAIVVCFGSTGDYGDSAIREAETREAMTVLGGGPVEQWQGGDLVAQMQAYEDRVHPATVWAPHPDASHPDHVAVARAARRVFGTRVQRYHTYNAEGKVRYGRVVDYEPVWLSQKMRALLRYETQITHPRAHTFFAADLVEYAE